MKFTKTLAISLLALGAMQFAMAETINIDNKEALTLQNTKGDTLDLQITVCEGSCGEELLIQAPNEYLTYTKSKISVDRAHNLYTISLKFNNTPSDKPLVISTALPNGTVKSHTITFKPPFEPALLVQTLPAEKPVKQLIDVDLTKKTGEINLIEAVKTAGSNKAFFESGDIIHLILSENPTTGYQNILLSLPSFLHLKNYAYEAPKKGGLIGAPGIRHIGLEIAKDISGMDLTKPLIISYARSWEADRPETYTINFKMLTPAVQPAPEKERALGSKFTTPKKR
jgi:predicted secreted protein